MSYDISFEVDLGPEGEPAWVQVLPDRETNLTYHYFELWRHIGLDILTMSGKPVGELVAQLVDAGYRLIMMSDAECAKKIRGNGEWGTPDHFRRVINELLTVAKNYPKAIVRVK